MPEVEKCVLLGSSPQVHVKIPPPPKVNSSPALGTKCRGAPILGQRSSHPLSRSSCYVPLVDGSDRVKALLELPESDASPGPPVEGRRALSESESGKDHEKSKVIIDQDFKTAAREYLRTPDLTREDAYPPPLDRHLDQGGVLHAPATDRWEGDASASNVAKKHNADVATPLVASGIGATAAAVKKNSGNGRRHPITPAGNPKKTNNEGKKKAKKEERQPPKKNKKNANKKSPPGFRIAVNPPKRLGGGKPASKK